MDSGGMSGVKVYGSALLLVEPDAVSLKFAVERRDDSPAEAFRLTQEAVRGVRAFLAVADADRDAAVSRITLRQLREYASGREKSLGFAAKVGFHVVLTDLERLEAVLTGVVGAGADSIEGVEFRTTRLKEHRAEARRRAVAAAREKALNYCRAAGVSLGSVVGIEDMNPNQVRGSGEGDVTQADGQDDESPTHAFSTGSIFVGAAVSMTYSLDPAGNDAES